MAPPTARGEYAEGFRKVMNYRSKGRIGVQLGGELSTPASMIWSYADLQTFLTDFQLFNDNRIYASTAVLSRFDNQAEYIANLRDGRGHGNSAWSNLPNVDLLAIQILDTICCKVTQAIAVMEFDYPSLLDRGTEMMQFLGLQTELADLPERRQVVQLTCQFLEKIDKKIDNINWSNPEHSPQKQRHDYWLEEAVQVLMEN